MRIVGRDREPWSREHVHTIDIWYSRRRRRWIVERLDLEGHLLGASHSCADVGEAEACLADWLRTHDEAHLATSRPVRGKVADPRKRQARPRTQDPQVKMTVASGGRVTTTDCASPWHGTSSLETPP